MKYMFGVLQNNQFNMALYKYLHPERIDVLENLKLRFTQPSVLNDPFESLPMIDKIMEESDFYKIINDHVGQSELRSTVMDTLKQELSPYQGMINMDLFLSEEFIDGIMDNFEELTRPFIREALNSENIEQSYSENFKESFSSTFGILSLTQNPDNLLMWSHYSDSHRGFLIEFNQEADFFDQQVSENDTIRKLKKVKYVTKRPHIESLIDIERADEVDYMEKLIDQFFLIKSDVWEYEKEMRMVLPLENSDELWESPTGEKVYLFNIHPNVIKSVVFGSQMEEDGKKKICELLNETQFDHVNVYRSELDMSNYKVNIVNA